MTHTHCTQSAVYIHIATTDTPGNWNNRKFKTIPLKLSK